MKSYNQKKKEHWEKFNYKKWFIDNRGTFINETEKNAVKELLKKYPNKHFKKCLDVGIGNGRLIPAYKDKCRKIVGLDISNNLLKEAKKNYHITVKQGDAENLPFKDKTFDLIINTRVLQHLKDRKECIEEMFRVAKLDAIIIIMVYNRFSIYGIKKYFKRLFNPTCMRYGRFDTIFSIKRYLKDPWFEIKKIRGAVMCQPELLRKDMTKKQVKLGYKIERLATSRFKYFGGRLVLLLEK